MSVFAPSLSPCLRLMRLHQPVGIWLLLWPCLWAVTLASRGNPEPSVLVLFALGAVFMRSAGCIVNDMADRTLDRQVERTKDRPLASGELSMTQGSVLLSILLLLSAMIALRLGIVVMLWAVLSLIPVAIYPFMKRISWWPQLFLGLTFNWGALMGWAAVRGEVETPALMLYGASVFWTLGYDTIYAHQDKADDRRAGIKSLALRLGNHTRQGVGLFYLIALTGWAGTGWLAGCGPFFYSLLTLAGLHMGWQLCRVNLEDPASCKAIFVSNIALGLLMMTACFAGFVI